MQKLSRKQGFTMAELLIVVAIIAVLVAVSIPVFSNQLEKAREATDASNIRAAYAQVQAAALLGESVKNDFKKNDTDAIKYDLTGSEGSFVYTAEIKLKQQQDDWLNKPDIGGISLASGAALGASGVSTTPRAGGTATITYTQADNTTTLKFGPKTS